MGSEEQSQPSHIPTLEAVNTAYADIAEHNREHTGLSPMLMGIMGGLVIEDSKTPGAEAPDFYEKVEESMQVGVVEGDMDAALQDVLHSDTFMRIGIKLTPSGSYGVDSLHNKVTSEALNPSLENVELYTDFLGTVTPEQIEMKEDQLLPAVLANLSSRISLCYGSGRQAVPAEFAPAVAEYGEDALRAFSAIEPEYQRLGLDAETLRAKYAIKPEPNYRYEITRNTDPSGHEYNSSAQHPTKSDPAEQEALMKANEEYDIAHQIANTWDRLEGYIEHWGAGVLPEYVIAANEGYVIEPDQQGFGPAQWHYDGGQRNWRQALEFVAQLGRNNRTEQFAEEVRAGLVHSLDTAIGEIDASTGEEQPYYASQRPDLMNIRNALTGQEFDSDRLEKYTQASY